MTRPDQKHPKPAADWLAWSLQWALGFFLGWCAGMRFTEGGYRSLELISTHYAGLFKAGLGLVLAAIASRYGDRLWYGDSYRIIPPDVPGQDKASRVASLVSGGTGIALVVTAVVRTFLFHR